MADELVISYLFPPVSEASGMVMAKRIIEKGTAVDIVHDRGGENQSYSYEIVDRYIDRRFLVDIDYKNDSVDFIFEFIRQASSQIGDDYKKVYSRSFLMANHFLALEYKLKHPNVIWTAEFSDPVLRYLYTGKAKDFKTAHLDNPEYVAKINAEIEKRGFDKIENPNNMYYLAEYLTYIFADEIIFTNPNQRKIMLEDYDDKIRELVMSKSTVSLHPTLDGEYYHLRKHNLTLNEDDINIGYFGGYYYYLRHFESIFHAYESLNHKYRDKIKFHMFLSEDQLLKALIEGTDIEKNMIIQKPIDYLEFLNATTQFDILLINDTITEGNFSVNPYLPSKLSDYLGSERDIWAIYEEGSMLSAFDARYKSSMKDYTTSCDVLIDILNDHGYADEDYSFDDNYYEKRITELNRIVKKEFDAKNRYRRQAKKLKRQNKKLKDTEESPSKIKKAFGLFSKK